MKLIVFNEKSILNNGMVRGLIILFYLFYFLSVLAMRQNLKLVGGFVLLCQ